MMVFSLANQVRNKFKGMLVFGDVHADYESFMYAYDYAERNNYFFMSLGDLVDSGPQPYETVTKMAELVREGKAGFTLGNHDDKMYRLGQGRKVSLSSDARQTLINVTPERQEAFLKLYAGIVDTPTYSSLSHTFDDITLVHAASHPSMWSQEVSHSKEMHARAMYGQVNGEKYANGFPIRYYNWIEEVPMGKTVIVGHDRAPVFNVAITEPMVRVNTKGGKVIFMDTGCGKGGFLTGAVILPGKNRFKVDHFESFAR
jgi:hypothetical protein